MKFFSDRPNLIVWHEGRRLCKFNNGIFETKIKKEQDSLINLGYKYEKDKEELKEEVKEEIEKEEKTKKKSKRR